MRISPLSFDLSAALNSHNWLKQFSQASIKRAQRYARGSALTTLSMQCLEQNALTLTAQVQGTARRPYRTRVEIFGIGDRFGYICDCSCPVEVDCKHAAAVLIAASSMSVADWTVLANRSGPAKSAAPRRKTAPPAPAPPAWRQWLGSLGPPEPKIATASVSAPTRSLAVLLDAVTYRQPGQMIASLVWVRPTLAGRLGNIEQVRLRGFANDLESGEIDDAWHDRIARLQVGEPQPRAGHWFALTGRHGEWLLEDLLRSGAPCFWQKPTNGELRRGEDRTLDWCWTAATNGEQTLQSGATSTTPLIAVNGLWQWDPGSRCLHRLTGETTDLAAALLRLPPLPPEQAAGLAEAWRVHPRLSALPAPRVFAAGPPLREPPVPVLRLLQLPMNPGYGAGEDEQVRHLPCVRLEFDYAGQRLDGPASAGLVTRINGDSLQRIERQFLAEQAAQAALHDVAGPIDQRHDLRWQLRDPPHPADYIPVSARGPGDALIVLQHVTALQAQGFRLEFDPNFPLSLSAPPDDWFLDVTESETGNAWFEAELGIDIDGERISLLPILQRALSDRTLALQPAPGEPADAAWYAPLDKVRHIALPLSQVRALLAPLMQWLGDGERLRIPRVCAGVLDELSEIEQLRLHTRTAKAITALATQLREGGSGKRIPLPRTLKAELRPYQRDGLDWLGFLGRANLGGVLADDMGLGKTVQVLAHLLAEKQARRLPRPALIVVPTSVIGNWREQAKRFAPSLRVLVLHGGDRHFHFQSLDNCDVAITTYALLPRDRECLRREHFSLAVFDEAQALKNPRSKAAIVARELNASRRLVVTGTPLENHLGDLWAQFDCVLPGLLGDSKAFTRHFRTPIEKHADPERQARLNRQVAPFLLRRSKEQVAPELPSKTEVVQTLELTGKQRALYETLRLAMHDKVQKAIAKRGLGQSSIIILDALLKLRQVCCDPRLVNLDAARTLTSSAKLDALLPMLEELLAEGRRILLFSQFTQMLDLIEDELRARKLPWLRLDGSTRDRDTPVQRFQAGDCPLFLVSLKAGGVGLNLTAADTVIHFDPWWNPAVERQATDRAHRIGQDKPVFVYKLICAGTVEEKIQAMQQRKAALAEAVLSGGSRHSLRFDEDDIAALFAPLADPAP